MKNRDKNPDEYRRLAEKSRKQGDRRVAAELEQMAEEADKTKKK